MSFNHRLSSVNTIWYDKFLRDGFSKLPSRKDLPEYYEITAKKVDFKKIKVKCWSVVRYHINNGDIERNICENSPEDQCLFLEGSPGSIGQSINRDHF
jgi:hypothetical protein